MERKFTPELKKRQEEIAEKNRRRSLKPGLYSLKRSPDVPVPSSKNVPIWEVAAPFNKVENGVIVSEL